MRKWFQRMLVTGVAALSVFSIGLGGATAASAAPALTTAEDSVPTTQAYIYNYYRLYLDCEVAGAYGLSQGWWRYYICDNRYLPGYFALVIP